MNVETLAEYPSSLVDASGAPWVARACGSRREEDGLWEGWIEFEPASGGSPLRTPRETTQPNHADLAQ